jgi:hypothetical protein
MNAKTGNEHDWFRRRLPDYLLDLLDEGARARFDAHARACPACAKLLGSALGERADWWDGAGHLPVGTLMAWDVDAPSVGANAAVREHLASCESCRRDLEDLRGPEAVRALVTMPAAARRAVVPFPSRWMPAAISAATAAAAAFVMVMWVADRPAPRHEPQVVPPTSVPAVPSTGSGAQPTAPAMGAPTRAIAPGPAASAEPEPVEVRAPERGAAAEPTTVDVPAGAARVRLTLPALPVPEQAQLTIELLGPDGALLFRQVLTAELALRRGGVALPAAHLAAGPHRLRVTWTDSVTGESAREYALDVRTSR